MSDGILKEVLQLEKKIEAALAEEQARAEAWLAETCREIDQELSCEQTQDDRSYEQQSAVALQAARNNAAQQLRRERQRARTLTGLPNDRLLRLLDGRLQTVLTGRDDDCPDDQS